ncbi:type-F conjugative transfer system pilin assembly protein TraF [Pantoea sp. BAV 3049]|uniref:type-F conjugative transfer system pilin assembly protein TraF n=1 Tax=Pantoea sp. BAV 3049 TaxID=2654188 RepID=UPI001E602A6A|nr:type-F conjugative transfer system pilin assembly protein TraF [Pantoea sp. BAV 3049]
MKQTLPTVFLLLVTGAQAATVSPDPSQSAFPPPALSSTGTYVDTPIVGWHWYNEPQPEEEDEPDDDTVPLSVLPPNLQMSLLQKLTKEKLNSAILSPSPEKAADYLRMQSYLMNLSGQFTQSAKKALLLYPDLDYNLEHSRYNGTATLQQTAARQLQNDAIHNLGQRYGLFLFYRGNNPQDMQMAATVHQFSQQYGLSLIPISMDGARSEALPQTRQDIGQAAKMGVSQFPALMLVEPGSEQYQPLAYGFMTQDDLARRFLDVATDFKAQY